jgi:hypothetical protein
LTLILVDANATITAEKKNGEFVAARKGNLLDKLALIEKG